MVNWKFHLLTIVWAVVIAILTLSPGRAVPDVPFWNIPHFDKIVHAGIFGMLSFLMARGTIRQYAGQKIKKAFVISFFVAIGYGLIIEYLQRLVPGRSFELSDLMANTAGAVLGLIGCHFLSKLFGNRS